MKGRRNQHLSPVGSPPSDTESSAAAMGIASDNSSKEQDRYLPIANVSRIMKKSLPGNAKISKEAKEIVQECVSEFISFITGEASDKCLREKRKTINGDDLLWSMSTLGFENYVGPLKAYLNKYRETEGDQKNSMARQGDQFPTEEGNPNHTSDQGFHGINSIANTNSSSNKSLSSFNGTFYPFGRPVVNQGFEGRRRVMGYGENPSVGGFNVARVNETGGANGARVLAGSHGVKW